MREIKFRVWNDFIKKHETLQEVASRGAIMPRGNELKTTVNYPLIIEQFTGLKDKNGKDIYEGDIATYTDNNNQTDKVGVYFENGTFLIFKGLAMLALHLADLSKLEVIGNIHEVKE